MTDTETFTLTITDAPDRPPVLTAIGDQSVQADATPLELNIIATDPDGQTPTLTYSPDIDYATFTDNGNGTATLRFSPGRDVLPGTTNITITASSGSLTDTETFTLTITDAPDRPPVLTAIGDQSVQADATPLELNIIATDPDGQTPTLTYSPDIDYATFTDNGNGTATLRFSPGRDILPGTTNITITASSGSLTDTETFTLTITDAPDRPPVLTAIGDQSVQADATPLELNIIATDPDGQTPTLTYSPDIDYATFTDNGNGTATLRFSPGRDVFPGTTNITITASSGSLTDTETFTLTITDAPDRPPVLTAIGDQSVQADATPLELNIIATDPDGQTPTLTYSPILDYATFTDNTDGTATLVLNPGMDVDPEPTILTITATSGELTDMEQFILTITPRDMPPMITAIENQMVQAGGSPITVNITATDPDDGQTPSLDYSPALDYATFTDNTDGTATLVFNPGLEVDPEPTILTITATSGELTDMEQFILTITPPDNPPIITTTPTLTISTQTVQSDTSFTVSITATDPDEGQTPIISTSPSASFVPYLRLTSTGEGTAELVFRADSSIFSPRETTTITITASSGEKQSTIQLTIFIVPPPDTDNDGVSDTLDVDDDNDGLIEINTLEELDNIRYNLAGTSYKTSAVDPDNMNGAPESGLKGYELARDLDFNDPASYSSGMINTAWTMGEGWLPIGDDSTFSDSTRFTGILEGNGYTITNLMIRRDTLSVGLFDRIGTSGQVRNLGIENAVVDSIGISQFQRYIGLLAGVSDGTIIAVHTSGIANSGENVGDHVGGLVGLNNGTITACHATGNANGRGGNNNYVGGLVGTSTRTITACYATGNANGGESDTDRVGGLVGVLLHGTITACYATGNANGGDGDTDRVGGLVGDNFFGTITACYATGMADGGDGSSEDVGRLVGKNDSTGTITASHGFGTVTREGRGVNRSGDASDTVGSPSGLTIANSSTMNDNRWPARVWDFGTDSQVPVLKWITGYDSSGATEAERYPCDETLLPAGGKCGEIIPGQVR